MINFRYHVVSLTAVFLALAIGLVVGTAALNGPVADSFDDQVTSLGKKNEQLREQVSHLEDELTREEQFATEAAPALVGGTLSGRRLLLVVLPGEQKFADQLATMLTAAGATLTGRITVQNKFVDPANALELLDLSDKASQPSLPAGELPNNVDGVETSGALLGAALLDRNPAVEAADQQAVLAAYTSAGYLTVDAKVTGPAEAAVVVAASPPVDKDAAARNSATVTLVSQFATSRPAVVAAGSVGDGSLVSAVRADPALVKAISTVDNAATVQGQVATALAAAEVLQQARTGQYGLTTGATSLLPKKAAQ